MQVEFEGWWWVTTNDAAMAQEWARLGSLPCWAAGLFEQILGVHLRRSRAPRPRISDSPHTAGVALCATLWLVSVP